MPKDFILNISSVNYFVIDWAVKTNTQILYNYVEQVWNICLMNVKLVSSDISTLYSLSFEDLAMVWKAVSSKWFICFKILWYQLNFYHHCSESDIYVTYISHFFNSLLIQGRLLVYWPRGGLVRGSRIFLFVRVIICPTICLTQSHLVCPRPVVPLLSFLK